jgi:hypothetical protein
MITSRTLSKRIGRTGAAIGISAISYGCRSSKNSAESEAGQKKIGEVNKSPSDAQGRGQSHRIRVLVFDAHGTLFDVYSVVSPCEQIFPGQGLALSQMWRTKQLEYSWLRSVLGRYEIVGK